MVNLHVREQPPEFVRQYGIIPIAFDVREHLAVESIDGGIDGLRLNRHAVEVPYTKDYDAIPGQRPLDWPNQWDLAHWCLCGAYRDGEHIGGVAIVLDSRQVCGSCNVDEAVLWDIRVRTDQRKLGVGRKLLAFAELRARSAGKLRLVVETQNNNVAACQLYASAGFELRSVDRFAYPLLPDEVQLIWSKQLVG